MVTEVMAHTGDGKSAFLRQIAEGAARAGAGVLWIVAEDPEDATAERQLSGATGIDTAALGRAEVSSDELGRLDQAAQAATWGKRVLPVFENVDVDEVLAMVDDTPTVGGAPLGLVLVDYVQLLAPSRELESEVARLGVEMHARARDRRFAVAAGAQVSTEVTQRGRERWYSQKDISAMCPGLGDTEWCRRLEKLSKAVWALYRPGRWKREFGEDDADDTAELHVRKSNFGPTGWVRLGWDGPSCRFTN